MCVLVLAARIRPRFALSLCPRETEGAGKAGCRLAPAVPVQKKVHRANHRYSRDIPALPARMVLTAYSALFPATNSSCHRHRRIEWCARSGWIRNHLRRLDTSNGCQDHTALPSATAPFVLRAAIAHETLKKSALRSLPTRAALSRPPHPRPNVRDDRDTPLMRAGTTPVIPLMLANDQAVYFSREGSTV